MRLLIIAFALTTLACTRTETEKIVSTKKELPKAPYPSLEQTFIPDSTPLEDTKRANFLNLLSTLPFYDDGSKRKVSLVMTESGHALRRTGEMKEWQVAADTAQPAVRVLNLSASHSEPMRIRIIIAPGPTSPYQWTYGLERTTGGWNVLSKEYKKL
ncbi:hypothetical protein SAMN02745181_1391 [Rubritalea squalenifaciens DSM 18772]|uniref:Lipoprotein n=1 Tax=Rubritalea squalenifaciens DSM 18772 TaxID=1123071 RepID=A0A1M6H883_9BACT|nr:hypothetical protein [Rubritalea squalenifaciens]SHJ18283.1 hypothetical protein SAMN02745181_1391 [Rubritalea squalenifaciens DSM 18772]